MSPRRLVLRREALTELSPGDLRAVAAGTARTVTVLRTRYCPTSGLFSGMYPSINVDCTSALDLLETGDSCEC